MNGDGDRSKHEMRLQFPATGHMVSSFEISIATRVIQRSASLNFCRKHGGEEIIDAQYTSLELAR